MRASSSFVGALGIDTIEILTDLHAAALRAAGFSFAARYVQHIGTAELASILGAGLAFVPIAGYARVAGWTASAGQQDALETVNALHDLGIPNGTTVWLDLEGEEMTVDAATQYAVAWAKIVGTLYTPGLYVGAGVPLTADQLYTLPFRGYWHSCSEVPNVARVGYQMIQLYPPNQVVAGLQVDIDVIQADKAGRFTQWVLA